ncbi:hypothetical protein PF003_g21903 [Phytophthora fragariae]|nr:hypothetical protein PF003_g21903 [Phytophthora fragariae]
MFRLQTPAASPLQQSGGLVVQKSGGSRSRSDWRLRSSENSASRRESDWNLEILAAQAKREMLLAEKEGYKTKVLLALTRKQLRDQGVSEEEIDRVLPVNSNIAMVTNEAAAVSSTTVDSPDSELH